jgi:hypothetical protein
LFLSSGVTSKLEQGTDQPEKADRLRKDDQSPGRIATLVGEVHHDIRSRTAAF